MRSKRLVICGALALGSAAPFASACGDSSFEPAASDASIVEATTPDTTSPPPATDAATFCTAQSTAVLCADFDELDLRAGFELGSQITFFSGFGATGGGLIGAADAGLSPPTALELALPVDAGPPTDAAVETASATGTLSALTGMTHFRLEADLRFNHIGDLSSGTIALGGLNLAAAVGHTVYVLDLRDGHIFVDVAASPFFFTSLDLGSVPSEGPTWNHLSIDLMSGNGGQIIASIAGRAPVFGTSYLSKDEVLPTVSIGASTMGGTGVIDMSVDNVLFFADSPDAGPSPMPDASVVVADAGGD